MRQRHHRARATVVVFGRDTRIQGSAQFRGGGILRDARVAGLQLLDGGCVEDALVELHGENHDGAVEGVG